MTKYDSEVADAHQNLQPVLQNIKELKRKVRNAFLSTVGQFAGHVCNRTSAVLLCLLNQCL